jgi:hypothetical protein
MQLITEAQELTDTWANLGGIVDMRSFNGLSLFFGLDINDSENLQFRAVYKRSLNDQDNYEATIGELTSGDMVLSPKVYELGVDADGNYSLKITTNNTAPYLQLQVQVLTEGVSAGDILTADYFTSHFIDVNASEGGGGGGGSALTLQTDGVANGSQVLLNLAEGSNITLTDNGTGTVTIAAAGGGGGIQTASVTLTAAQMNALNGAPQTILAAQGANTVIVPLGISVKLNYSSAFNTGGADLEVGYTDGSQTIMAVSYLAIEQTADTYYFAVPMSTDVIGAGGTFRKAFSTVVNAPIIVLNQNSNYTNGTGSTVTFTISYYVINYS